VGDPLPEFELIGTDLRQITNETFAGTRLIISIFPSIKTPSCQEQLRCFHEQVSQLDNTKLLCVSRDLPFTLKRFAPLKALLMSSLPPLFARTLERSSA